MIWTLFLFAVNGMLLVDPVGFDPEMNTWEQCQYIGETLTDTPMVDRYLCIEVTPPIAEKFKKVQQ